jgi:hypothetical protein
MELRLDFLRLELFVELLRMELLVLIIVSIITIVSNIIRGRKFNKRVFYYSVEIIFV